MQLSQAKYNFRKVMVRKAEHIFLVKAFHSLQFYLFIYFIYLLSANQKEHTSVRCCERNE